MEEIVEECDNQTFEKHQREALSKSLIYIFKSDLKAPCVDETTNLVQSVPYIFLKLCYATECLNFVIFLSENLSTTPSLLMCILDALLQLKPSDKSPKSKNLFRILTDIVTALPTTAYKILLMLEQL